ncbi:TPA: acyltransferase [Escherichia coli]|nr:acyltransferase [Escherichia coli]HAO1322255.1 acyltransferase [Escherichia coli]
MNRIYSLDLVKTVAIFLVIFTHLKENMGFYGLPDYAKEISYYIDRMGVPLFFMVSGVLMLSSKKTFSAKTTKRVIFIIIGVSATSIITNFIYYHLFSNLNSILVSIEYNNAITTKNIDKAYQLWYMFYYLPLFILAIPLSAFTATASQCQLAKLCTALFVMGPLSQVIQSKVIDNDFIYILTKTDLFSYLLYMTLGLYIFRMKKKHSLYLTIAILVATTLISSFASYNLQPFFKFDVWYSRDIALFISSSCLFYILCKIKAGRYNKFVTIVSQNSYAMYLLHVAIIYLFVYIAGSTLKELSYKIIFSLIIIITSIIVSHLLNKTALKLILQ